MKYFVFCQSDLVLQKTGDSYQIPEEAPTELKPWTTVMDIDGAKAYRIDQPITNSDRYEMCGLRQSYYKLSEADYRLAGKCRELLYWDQSTKFCGVCGGTMHFDSWLLPSSCWYARATRCCWYMPTTSATTTTDWWQAS